MYHPDHNVAKDDIRTIKIKSNGLKFSSAVELENSSPKNTVWKFPHLNQDQLINMGGIIKREFILQNNEVYQ
jgi:hypothetical protein